MSLREEARAQARVTVVAISLGSLLGILGSLLGALRLAGIGLANSLLLIHPELQLFGFLTLFIMGVAYSLMPRIKNRRLSHRRLAYLSIGLIFTANIVLLADGLSLKVPWAGLASNALLLMGSIAFALIALSTLGRPRGPLWIAEPFMLLSIVSLLLSIGARLLEEPDRLFLSLGYLNLVILGFPSMMVFGVMIRTIHFRFVNLRNSSLKGCFVLALLGIILSFTSLRHSAYLEPASSLFLLVSGLFLIDGVGTLRAEGKIGSLEHMCERDRVRHRYFTKGIKVASAWLILGLSLGLTTAMAKPLGLAYTPILRDALIHSLAIGFIGSSIVAYGPILLPALISRHAPYKGLSLVPLYTLTIGNVLRIMASLLKWIGLAPWPGLLSGSLIMIAIIHFLIVTHRLRD